MSPNSREGNLLRVSFSTLHGPSVISKQLSSILCFCEYETIAQFPKHTLDIFFGESISPVLTRTATSPCTHCAVHEGTWPSGPRESGSWNSASTLLAKPCALTWGCLKEGAPLSNLHKGAMWPNRVPDIQALSTWLDSPCSIGTAGIQ